MATHKQLLVVSDMIKQGWTVQHGDSKKLGGPIHIERDGKHVHIMPNGNTETVNPEGGSNDNS